MPGTLAFFGAFNPPTRAHIDLAEYAMRGAGKDEVIFVPSKSVYITEDQQKSFAFSDSERLEMLARIAENRPWMRFTDIEMKQETQPRTYATLCMLREKGITASLLVGADKLIELDTKWVNVPEISSEFGIVCMDRGELDCEAIIRESSFLQSLNLTVVKVPEEYKDFSSTYVRNGLVRLIGLGKELRDILPPELGDLPQRMLDE